MTDAGSGAAPQLKGSEKSETERFRRRARTLAGTGADKCSPRCRPFREAIARERERWDQKHPDHPIGSPLPAPPPADAFGPGPPMPESLARAYLSPDADRVIAEDPDLHEHATMVVWEWREMVLNLCAEWWPSHHFPNWDAGSRSHPAAGFVAGCLLADPWTVPEEWVSTLRLGHLLTVFSYNPLDQDQVPETTYWRTWAESLWRTINTEAESGKDAFTRAELGAIAKQAVAAAREARRSAYKRGGPFVVLALPPRLNSTDLNTLRQWILPTVEGAYRRTHSLAIAAKEMKQRGMPVAAIAEELGVERPTVYGWLKPNGGDGSGDP